MTNGHLVRHVRRADGAVGYDELQADDLQRSHLIFKVGGRNVHQDSTEATWLAPARHTKSPLLRAALAPITPFPATTGRGIA